jgi:hypothetical protein
MFNLSDISFRWPTSQPSQPQENDEESFGPSSLSYNVNMTPSPKKPSPAKKDSAGGSQTKPRTRSTSRAKGRSSQEDAIGTILQLCRDTNEEVTKIRSGLELVTNELGEVKKKMETVDKRVEKVEKDTGEIASRVESLEKKQEEMESKLEEKLLKKLKNVVPSSSSSQFVQQAPTTFKTSTLSLKTPTSLREPTAGRCEIRRVRSEDSRSFPGAVEDSRGEEADVFGGSGGAH